MNKNVFIFVFMFLIIGVVGVLGATCVTINTTGENNLTAGDWIICGAVTQYNFTLSNSGWSAFNLIVSGTKLDCNGSRLHGNGTGKGIVAGFSGTQWINISNCIIDGFTTDIYYNAGATAGLWNSYINNVEVFNATGGSTAGLYCGGYGNITINNSYFHDSNVSGLPDNHGIYVSSAAAGNDNRSCKNFKVYNTRLIRNGNSGIQFNGRMYHTGVVLNNVTSCDNYGSGFNIYTVSSADISNITACRNGVYGLNLWRGDQNLSAANSTLKQMVFGGNNFGAIVLNNNTNNTISNLTFESLANSSIIVGDTGVTKVRIYVNVPIYVSYVSGSAANGAKVYLNYSAPYARFLTVNENNVTLTNQILSYPFNDVRNVTNASFLAVNTDNYSIILATNQAVSVGNYSNLTLTLNSYSNGTVFPNCVDVNFTVTDYGSIYGLSTFNVYSSAYVLENSTNTTLLDYSQHTCGIGVGTHYLKVLAYDNKSNSYSVDSGFYYFIVSDSILVVPPVDESSARACHTAGTNMIDAMGEFPVWMLIMVVVLVAGVLVGMALYMVRESGYSFNFDIDAFLPVIFPFVVTAIIIVAAIIILSTIC